MNNAAFKRELKFAKIAIAIVLVGSLLVAVEVYSHFSTIAQQDTLRPIIQQIVFAVIVSMLIYGGLVFLITRLGCLKRSCAHRPAGRDEIEVLFDGDAPRVAILVPSYREDADIVRRTLLSAALQDYPNRQVVLLIDDPPQPTNQSDHDALTAMLALPTSLNLLLAEAAEPFSRAYYDYLARVGEGSCDISREATNLSNLYRQAARWFDRQAADYPRVDHGDDLLVKTTFQKSAIAHRERADNLEKCALDGSLDSQRVGRDYRQLASLFDVKITSFERKKYVNLSHAPNKAMNLNSYISLLGGAYREVKRAGEVHLESSDPSGADVRIPDAEFLITLDADSLLSTDYTLRLTHHMIQTGNERIAVAQTPYSAIPDPPGILERIAGATTDIQYIIHQGFERHGATFWVGANALLRKKALEDIRTERWERGFRVATYIQDRTVIEDTESSVDLIDRGWRLYNYPERLAFSATPADFGALLIQRRRWANGGLIILPKLFRYLIRSPRTLAKAVEGFFRFHYLFSITAVNFGLVLLLSYPFEENIRSFWLPLAALPYFFFYIRDLKLIGYRRTDIFRVYALNLLLIPVNLGGVLKSLQQAITGRTTPFGRTPKVSNRTATPLIYVLAEYGLLFLWLLGFAVDSYEKRWVHAGFSLMNSLFLAYALYYFVGLKESVGDFRLAFSRLQLGQMRLLKPRLGFFRQAAAPRLDRIPASDHRRSSDRDPSSLLIRESRAR